MCDGDFCLGPMLNAYPDSLGGTLKECISFLEQPEMKDVFSSFYILPSLFSTDLDRGFSVSVLGFLGVAVFLASAAARASLIQWCPVVDM